MEVGVNKFFKDMFTVDGRCSLYRYWLHELTGTGIQIIYFLTAYGIMKYRSVHLQTLPDIEAMVDYAGDSFATGIGLLICYFLLTFILHLLSIGISVRRCHDIGWKGAWVVLKFIPVIGSVTFFFMMWCKGSSGANAYGVPESGENENSRVAALINLGSQLILLITFLLFIREVLLQFYMFLHLAFGWALGTVFAEYYAQTFGT